MPFDKTKPFNALPELPPEKEIETKQVLKKVISASRVLSNLNGAMLNLPNPRLFLDTIHLQEAKASSEIENIITTNDEIYKSAVADLKTINPAAKEVLSYKEALWYGLEKIITKPFITTNLCIEIVQRIKKNTSTIRVTPGTTLSNTLGEVIYTPPSGETVIRSKMANLENYINLDEDADPLIKMAIMHYQFEAIHPFADGNGRTGRILLLLYLKLQGLLAVPAIYLSKYIIKHKTEYYKRLRNVTETGDWEPYILYMLDMVEQTAKDALDKLNLILNSMKEYGIELKSKLPKVYSKEIIEIIFKLPYTKRKHLIDAEMGTPKTVGKYLSQIEKIGMLESVKVGKEKLYLNRKLMNILEK